MHTRDVQPEPQFSVQGQQHRRAVRGEARSRVDNGVGVTPLDVDSGDEPPSLSDDARREAFAKRDAQQRAQQRLRDSHLAQQHRVHELERMLEQEREARRACSVQETTMADSLDLSSMYEGHDQHAQRHHDTTSSSALHSELSTSDSPHAGEEDVTLDEVRSIDDDTSTAGDDVSLSEGMCSSAPRVVSDGEAPNHLDMGHTPYHNKDM
jgi:hypothetical protein